MSGRTKTSTKLICGRSYPQVAAQEAAEILGHRSATKPRHPFHLLSTSMAKLSHFSALSSFVVNFVPLPAFILCQLSQLGDRSGVKSCTSGSKDSAKDALGTKEATTSERSVN